MAKMKCAYIYLSQTQTTEGSYSGSVGGLGLTSGGLGVGVGGTSGTTNQETQTKLAELFAPIKNHRIDDGSSLFSGNFLFGICLMVLGSNIPKDWLTGSTLLASVQNIKEIVQFILLGSGGAIIGSEILKLHSPSSIKREYSEEQFKKITDRYNQVDYDTDSHTVELDGVVYPASRENFVKLIKGQ